MKKKSAVKPQATQNAARKVSKSPKKTVRSEFRSYPWISGQLRAQRWNTANPNENSKGEVWSQQECHAHPHLKAALAGGRPEYVIRISPGFVWVVEAKKDRQELTKALDEAHEYATRINSKPGNITAVLATGVAGNDTDGYQVRTSYVGPLGPVPVTLGEQPLTRFLSKDEALRIATSGQPNVDKQDMPVSELVSLSKEINGLLHSAKVEKEQRALLVANLLLCLHQDPGFKSSGDATVFLSDVNSRAQRVFKNAGKDALWQQVEVRAAAETVEDLKYALERIIDLLKQHDILHAASTADVLGSFFESFLRYGNTSKDLGIVLTPRHICWLAAEILNVRSDDIVYDPSAGTGGFLVAAFNRVRKTVTPTQAQNFAKQNLYGIEASGRVAALAFVNMFFRGDGKHNLKVDSCFNWRLRPKTPTSKLLTYLPRLTGKQKDLSPRVTKVLMTPPFSLKNDKQKESHFIEHALDQLAPNGLLFTVLPASVFYESEFSHWRQQTLTSHTLLAVIAFPTDLFYPVATESIGVVLKKGSPHANTQEVLWVRLHDDGFTKKKGYRVEIPGRSYKDALEKMAEAGRNWITGGVKSTEVPGVLEYRTIARGELLPQAHLDTPTAVPASEAIAECRMLIRALLAQQLDQGFHA